MIAQDADHDRGDRPLQETALFHIALSLLAVILGLSLLAPFSWVSRDLIHDPLGGHWAERILFIGFFADAVIYFHSMVVGLTLARVGLPSALAAMPDTASEHAGRSAFHGPARRPSTPALQGVTEFYSVLRSVWTATVITSSYFVIGVAFTVSVKAFFVACAVVGAAKFAYNTMMFSPPAPDARRLDWLRQPRATIRRMVADRRVPVTAFDLEVERTPALDPDTMSQRLRSWSDAYSWWSGQAALQLLVPLVCALLVTWAAGATLLAAIAWTAFVVGVDVILQYYLLPQYYSR